MTWTRAFSTQTCGHCRGQIQRNAVVLEIRIEDTTRRRCEACGRFIFGEGPIQFIPDVPPAPPKPSRVRPTAPDARLERPQRLPMPFTRQPDFVNTRSVAADYRRRQAGEDDANG